VQLVDTQQPSLVVLSGLPGAGKSHFQRELRRRTGALALESDAWRKRLFGRPTYSNVESATVFCRIRAVAARRLSQGQSVIIDATNLTEWERRSYYRIARRSGAKLLVVRLIAPEAVVLDRLQRRSAQHAGYDNSEAGIDVYRRMKRNWRRIGVPHIVVDTSCDITPALIAVAKAMESL
jgi:predicted kinase